MIWTHFLRVLWSDIYERLYAQLSQPPRSNAKWPILWLNMKSG